MGGGCCEFWIISGRCLRWANWFIEGKFTEYGYFHPKLEQEIVNGNTEKNIDLDGQFSLVHTTRIIPSLRQASVKYFFLSIRCI